MKIIIYSCILTSLFTIQVNETNAQLVSRRNFEMILDNNTFFTLHCDPKIKQGIFSKFKSDVSKGASFTYFCGHEKTLFPEGVEGHLIFTADDNNTIGGFVDIYFNNPASGDLTVTVDAQPPYIATYIEKPDRSRTPNTIINITVDTTGSSYKPPVRVHTDGSNNPVAMNMDDPIPSVINFDWEVIQRLPKDENDENNGKAYKQITYLFTSNGDYAAVKPDGESLSLMVYSKKGHTWMFDDTKKVITVMNMPKTVGEGGLLGKELAEKIKKAPLAKDKDNETFTITKSGKTKTVFGFTAVEYLMISSKINSSSKNAEALSSWYAIVPFDPVKIYTMGVGRPADLSKLQNDPRMKNNITAIPVLNKNYLWVEMDSGGKTGLETTSIKKVNNTVHTAGYKIKVITSFKDMMKGDDGN
jgi:hypothetical protein